MTIARSPEPPVTAGQGKATAAEWVVEHGLRTPGFAGAFLHGSVTWLPGEVHLPPSSDLDVIVVIAGKLPAEKPGKFRYRDVLLEVSYLPLSAVSNADVVLGNAHLAGSFRVDSVLADPTGALNVIHREVATHFAEEKWVLRRCADVEAKMRAPFPPADAPFPDQVNACLFPTGLTTHLLLVAGLRNPTVRLRYLAVREVLTDVGRLDAYPALLEDLGVLEMSPERTTSHLNALEAAFVDAVEVIRSPFFFAADISADGYPVAIGGTRELIAQGNHREAMFWLAATAVRCQQVFLQDAPHLLARHEPGFMAMLGEMGVPDRDALISRREAMLARLPDRWEIAQEVITARRDTTGNRDQPNRCQGSR